MLVDLFLVYQMIRRLATPFTEWKAFKTGVIDADGNIITPKENRSRDQKDSFGKYDLMILKLKKLLSKIPGGSSRIASYAAALWLIKEHNAFTESDSIESLTEEAMDESIQIFSETYSDYTTYLNDVNQIMMHEDGVPANNVGGGAIAGLGIGPDGEPGVSRLAQRHIRKKNRKSFKDFAAAGCK